MFSFLSRLCGCRCDAPQTDRKTMPKSEVEKTPEAPVTGPPPAGPAQPSGVRSPDERARGTRKTGSPETDLGAMNPPRDVS
jgi:hypothetical protein